MSEHSMLLAVNDGPSIPSDCDKADHSFQFMVMGAMQKIGQGFLPGQLSGQKRGNAEAGLRRKVILAVQGPCAAGKKTLLPVMVYEITTCSIIETISRQG